MSPAAASGTPTAATAAAGRHGAGGGDTALSFLQRRVATTPIVTHLPVIDDSGACGRGLVAGEGVLVAGARGAGKTQVLAHVTAHTAVQDPQGRVVYYDCGGGFDAQRVLQIITTTMDAMGVRDGRSPMDVLGQIDVVAPEGPLDLVHSVLELLDEEHPAEGTRHLRLVAVDGLAAFSQHETVGSSGHGVYTISTPAALALLRRKLHTPVVVATATPPSLARQIVADFAPSATILCTVLSATTEDRRVARVEMNVERAGVVFTGGDGKSLRMAITEAGVEMRPVEPVA